MIYLKRTSGANPKGKDREGIGWHHKLKVFVDEFLTDDLSCLHLHVFS